MSQATCTVCKGGRAEHFDAEGRQITQHMYTEREGELISQAEHAKAQAPVQRMAIPPGGMYMGNAGASVGRLCEVLLAKGVITDGEALYVAMMGPLPTPPSSYMDPLAPMRRQD